MTLGDAVPRNDAESVMVRYTIPGHAESTMKIRRGFYIGLVVAWDGDNPTVDYARKRA